MEDFMKAHVDVIFQQFSFLKEHYNKAVLTNARVNRIDTALACKECHFECLGLLPVSRISEDIRLFDENGNFLVRLGLKERRRLFGIRLLPNKELEGEQVWDAMRRTTKPVCYIVALYFVFRSDEGHVRELVVYKPPKGMTVTEWLEEQIRRARGEVAKDIAVIDAEA
jgi:hypothetical protein